MRTEEQRRKSREQSARWRNANRERNRELDRARYAKHREDILERLRARRANNPELYRAASKRDYERRKAAVKSPYHGFTRAEILEKLEQQGGACAICRVTSARWCGDHDHATGKFRAVLCNHCNTALGLLKDNPAFCRAAAEYLEEENL